MPWRQMSTKILHKCINDCFLSLPAFPQQQGAISLLKLYQNILQIAEHRLVIHFQQQFASTSNIASRLASFHKISENKKKQKRPSSEWVPVH